MSLQKDQEKKKNPLGISNKIYSREWLQEKQRWGCRRPLGISPVTKSFHKFIFFLYQLPPSLTTLFSTIKYDSPFPHFLCCYEKKETRDASYSFFRPVKQDESTVWPLHHPARWYRAPVLVNRPGGTQVCSLACCWTVHMQVSCWKLPGKCCGQPLTYHWSSLQEAADQDVYKLGYPNCPALPPEE